MSTELVPKNTTAIQLFTENGLDPILNGIQKKIDAFKPDTETVKGRKEITSFAYKIAQSKTFIDDAGKKLVAGRKEEIKKVDAERKRSRDWLDAKKVEVKKPLDDWNAVELKRVEDERLLEEYKVDYDEAMSMNELIDRERSIAARESEIAKQEEERRQKEESERLEKERIENEDLIKKEAEEKALRDVEEKTEKRLNDAALARVEILEGIDIASSLEDCKLMDEATWVRFFEKKNSAYQSEKNRLAIEKMESDRAENDRIAIEEKAKAERDRIAAEERAKIEKEMAVQKATKDAEAKAKSEREAEEKETARLKAIADKKSANTKHRAKINNLILSGLTEFGIPEDQAKNLVIHIAKGGIPSLQINY